MSMKAFIPTTIPIRGIYLLVVAVISSYGDVPWWIGINRIWISHWFLFRKSAVIPALSWVVYNGDPGRCSEFLRRHWWACNTLPIILKTIKKRQPLLLGWRMVDDLSFSGLSAYKGSLTCRCGGEYGQIYTFHGFAVSVAVLRTGTAFNQRKPS